MAPRNDLMGLQCSWLPVYVGEKHTLTVSASTLDNIPGATRARNARMDANAVAFKAVSERGASSPLSVPYLLFSIVSLPPHLLLFSIISIMLVFTDIYRGVVPRG